MPPSIQLYSLEKARFIIKDATNLDISYAYEDLVFSEHGLFILQFKDYEGSNFDCWFNHETNEMDEIRHFDSLVKTASLNAATISYQGHFSMDQSKNSDQINIQFLKK
jgi:hypothetical protein